MTQAEFEAKYVNTIVCGDCLEVMKDWPSGCVDMCVTSPPYWGLRDYGVSGQLGLEKTPEEYIGKMVAVFREVRRVLADYGVLFLNMGDSYGTQLKPKDLCGIPWRLAFALQADGWWLRQDIIWHKLNPMPESVRDRCTKAHEYLFLLSKKPKYYYDQEAIKEKVGEPTRRQQTYRGGCYTNNTSYDNSYDYSGHEPYSDGEPSLSGRNRRSVWTIPTQPFSGAHFATFPEKLVEPCILAGCPKEVCRQCGKPRERIVEKDRKATRPGLDSKIQSAKNQHRLEANMQSHKSTLASFVGNRDLYRHVTESQTIGWTDCGHADYRPGIVLDPFGGSGTTGMVAARLKRDYALIELSQKYIDEIAQLRLGAAETGVPVKEQDKGQIPLFPTKDTSDDPDTV